MIFSPTSNQPDQAPPGAQLPSKARDEVAILGALALGLVVAFPTSLAVAAVLLVTRGRIRYTLAAIAGVLGALLLLAAKPGLWAQHWLGIAKSTIQALSSHHHVDWFSYASAGAPAGLLVAGAGVIALSLLSGRLQPAMQTKASRPPSPLRCYLTRRRLARHPVGHPGRCSLGVGPTGKLAELSDVEANGHVLIVGATDSGKTVTQTAILTSAVARGRAVVLVDMKGGTRPAGLLAAAAQRYNRPFYWVTLSGPTHYNPLARGDYSERMSTLIGSEVWTEPHYQRQAARQLQLVLQALDDPAVRKPDGIWLPDVVGALSPAGLKQLATRVSSPTIGPALHALAASARHDPAALGGLAGRLGLLAESSAGRWMCRPPAGVAPFDLAQAIEDRAVVVFTLDSAAHAETAAQFGSFVIQDLKAIAGLRLACGQRDPVYTAIDEFSALAGPQLTGLVARGREAGMCVLLSTQELADLSAVSPAFCDQVVGNTNVKIIHRQDVADSAERLAGTMGTDRAWDVSLSQGAAPGLFARRQNRNLTWYPVDRNTVEPADLLRLPQGVALLIAKQPRLRVERVQVVPSALAPAELPERPDVVSAPGLLT